MHLKKKNHLGWKGKILETANDHIQFYLGCVQYPSIVSNKAIFRQQMQSDGAEVVK